jgi:hypothetical protein
VLVGGWGGGGSLRKLRKLCPGPHQSIKATRRCGLHDPLKHTVQSTFSVKLLLFFFKEPVILTFVVILFHFSFTFVVTKFSSSSFLSSFTYYIAPTYQFFWHKSVKLQAYKVIFINLINTMNMYYTHVNANYYYYYYYYYHHYNYHYYRFISLNIKSKSCSNESCMS